MQEGSQPVLPQRPFVGRERELTELRQGLTDVLAGGGRLFLVSGEPGIGKTRLAEELAIEARARGVRVIWGRSWAGDGAPAHWPWIQVVRSCLGQSDSSRIDNLLKSEAPQFVDLLPEMNRSRQSSELAARLQSLPSADPEEGRFRLFDCVARLLKSTADAQPLMIILDDLQEADQASLLMLRFSARQLKESSILLIATYREAEVRNSPVLSRLIGEIAREGDQLLLRGLSDSDLALWLRARGGLNAGPALITALILATGGNPLFIDGILRTMAAEGSELDATQLSTRDLRLPERVCETIRRRLGFLSKEAKDILSAASVIGQEFEFECLRKVVAGTPNTIIEALNEARWDSLIHPVMAGGISYRFAHDIVRETIYNDLPAAGRASLHLKIGQALEAIHQSDLTPHLAQLAHHYCESVAIGDAAKAIDYSVQAGEAALAVFAYEETAAHWKVAIKLLEQQSNLTQQRADLYFRLGKLSSTIDRTHTIHYLEAALGLYETLNQPIAMAQVHASLGNFMSNIEPEMDVQRALDHYHKGNALLRQASQSDSAELSAMINSGLAAAATRAMRVREGMAAARKAMKIARALRNEPLLARAGAQYSLHLFHSGRLAEALSLIERIWKKADALNNAKIAFNAAWIGGGCYAVLYDFGLTELWYERELSKPRTSNAQHRRKVLSYSLASNAVQTGQTSRALLFASEGPWGALPIQLAMAEGRWEEADTFGTQGYKNARQAGGREEGNRIFVYSLARARRILGRYGEAEAFLTEALSLSSKEPLQSVEMWARPELVLVYADMNQIEKAIPHLIRCRDILSEGENWRGLLGEVARAEAVVAAAHKNFADAEHKFEQARAILQAYSVRFEEAETLYCWGRALSGTGEHVRAAEKFEAAAEVYRNCGAGERWIERVLDAKSSLSATLAQPPRPADLQSIFRKQDDSWIISFGGKTSQLRDTKGLRYLACLLRSPLTEFPAMDLARDQTPKISSNAILSLSDFAENGIDIRADLDGAAPGLDARAMAEYRQRLADLKEELETAECHNDAGRKERLLSEIDALTTELKTRFRAGKDLTSATHRERARSTVSKRIRFALEQIRQGNPALANHLTDSIRTGYNCVYRPKQKIIWNF
jgi:predicted ATPase